LYYETKTTFPKKDRDLVLSTEVVAAPIEMVLVATASISYSASYVSRTNVRLRIRFYTFRILLHNGTVLTLKKTKRKYIREETEKNYGEQIKL
jgi:hypothetical protein